MTRYLSPSLSNAGTAAVALLVALAATPGKAEAQIQSQLVSVALTAYAPPGVHLAQISAGSGVLSLAGMAVNSPFRVELHSANKPAVVLLSRNRGGVVPWEEVQAAVGHDPGAVVLDVVVTPAL